MNCCSVIWLVVVANCTGTPDAHQQARGRQTRAAARTHGARRALWASRRDPEAVRGAMMQQTERAQTGHGTAPACTRSGTEERMARLTEFGIRAAFFVSGGSSPLAAIAPCSAARRARGFRNRPSATAAAPHPLRPSTSQSPCGPLWNPAAPCWSKLSWRSKLLGCCEHTKRN